MNMTSNIRQDILDRFYKRGKYEYGTPAYWEKERKAKFVINARKKEEKEREFYSNIINLWAMIQPIEMPLYNMLNN